MIDISHHKTQLKPHGNNKKNKYQKHKMTIISSNNTKSINGTELVLEADIDKSILVKGVHVQGSVNGRATAYIGGVTVGYFRTNSTILGNHLEYLRRNNKKEINVLNFLFQNNVFKGYPLAPGNKFTIKNSSAVNMSVIYDIYTEGDQTELMENGKNGKSLTYLHYGQTPNFINTTGDTLISKSNNPIEFSGFPFTSTVPPKRKIEVLGIAFSSRGADDGIAAANYIKTTYLKVMKNREVLFDEEKKGFIATGSQVLTANTFDAENGLDIGGEGTSTYQKNILLFDEKIVCVAGEELNFIWSTTVAAIPGRFEPEETEIMVILRETKE
ncbi:hypothetical protein [uncultured archaeal virus]|uniref:Uncharacterized protein n=1 Tax=uncultured archaeal virus TaxID=1960247 RepID=A0A8B0LQA0_9VIRU|nr:hypothetical protein [uncultured archaeal virus]